MKAKFNSERKTKYTSSHRKEVKVYFEEYAALVPSSNKGYTKAAVTLRLYLTDSKAYCCIWIASGPKFDNYTQGSGSAGGYGYHRPSAAAGEAIRNAGFGLSEDINGRGDEAIREAVQAIARAVGYPRALIHKAHA
jgi:hypothetical protein